MESTVYPSNSTDPEADSTPVSAPDVVSATAKVVRGEDEEEKWPHPVLADIKPIVLAPSPSRAPVRAPVKNTKRQSKYIKVNSIY